MSVELEKLHQQRLNILEIQRDIHRNYETDEDGNYPKDQQEKWDKAETDWISLRKKIEREETIEARSKELAEIKYTEEKEKRDNRTPNSEKKEEFEKRYEMAYRNWMRHGSEISAEDRKVLKTRRLPNDETEKRAAQTVTTTAGGYLIPEGFSNELEKTLLWFGSMLQMARIWNTPTGNQVQWPTMDDTSNTGRLLAINTTITNTALTFGQVTFNAYKYSSDSLLVPFELMEDSFFDFGMVAGDALGERLGRIVNTHMTTGTGSSQPNGIVTASAVGKTTASATAVTRAELVDHLHTVDRAYRTNAAWAMNDTTLSAIKKLAIGAGDARPLWQPSIIQGEPERLEGYPIWINNDIVDQASATKFALFGDFSKYIIRRVGQTRLVRLNERYADDDQVGFVAFMRFDGDLIETTAVKHLLSAT